MAGGSGCIQKHVGSFGVFKALSTKDTLTSLAPKYNLKVQ